MNQLNVESSPMDKAAAKGSHFVKDLGDAVRDNPIPAALIGMGLLWLFSGGRSARAAETVANGARSAAETVRDTGATVFDQAASTSSSYLKATSEFARNIPDNGMAMFGDAQESLTKLFKAQPLALGGVGLAIGAAIAAALPATRLEAEYLGEASDTVRSKVADLASEQTDRAMDVAESVINATADEARKQGLTTETLKTATDDLIKKAERVMQASRIDSGA